MKATAFLFAGIVFLPIAASAQTSLDANRGSVASNTTRAKADTPRSGIEVRTARVLFDIETVTKPATVVVD
jgi:hypothetical protein